MWQFRARKNQFFQNFTKHTNLPIMDKTLQKILKKVESVQLGLLRCSNEDKRLLLQARAGLNEESVNCIVNNENCELSLLSKNVNLIQKDKHDYLYITCKVKEEVKKNSAVIISMEVIKASWFIRKSRGSVSWLQEKYRYSSLNEEIDLAS